MKILLALNAFKESLSALDLCHELTEELIKYSEQFEVKSFPISDGGNGFIEVVAHHKNLELRHIESFSINGEVAQIPYLLDDAEQTIYLESAALIGLHLIPPDIRNPENYNSSALGSCLRNLVDLRNSGVLTFNTICIGVGGTATIDLGLGAVAAFYNRKQVPERLNTLFDENSQVLLYNRVSDLYLKLILDVKSKLIGSDSMVEQFGPQKGVRPGRLNPLKHEIESNLRDFSRSTKRDYSNVLWGAGGGLAVGLELIAPLDIEFSDVYLKNRLKFGDAIKKAELVITSEGKVDATSFLDKAPAVVLEICKNLGKKAAIICGSCDADIKQKLERQGVIVIELVNYFGGDAAASIKGVKIGLQKCIPDLFKEKF